MASTAISLTSRRSSSCPSPFILNSLVNYDVISRRNRSTFCPTWAAWNRAKTSGATFGISAFIHRGGGFY